MPYLILFFPYHLHSLKVLSFHHLIVPHKDCKKAGLGDGYLIDNGAILNQDTSHEYLHLIERIEREYFLRITKYMIEMNNNREIDLDNLKRIREILLMFEDEHKKDTNKKGRTIIKRQYMENRIPLNFDKK